MLSRLVDHAWWLYLALICAALGLIAGWWVNRKRAYLIGLGIVAGLAGIVFLLTRVVETDQKRILHALAEIRAGIQERNLDRTFNQLTDDFTMKFSRSGAISDVPRAEVRSLAERVTRNKGVTDIAFSDFEFEMIEPPKAVVSFRAKPFGDMATGSEWCGCRAEFRLDKDGRWRMAKVTLFHPIQGKEILELPVR
jgi:hypothetical protein